MSGERFEVGQLSAGLGEKIYGVVEFPVLSESYKLPLWLIHGDEAGPTLVVTAGVHGAEYASVAAALEFGQSLNTNGLRGRVIVVPVVNMPGFAARSIYVCPLDGKNPNRVFPGDAGGSGSEQLADWVFRNVIAQADYYVDMHGGDMIEELVPFTIFYRRVMMRWMRGRWRLRRCLGFAIWWRVRARGRPSLRRRRRGFRRSLRSQGRRGFGRRSKWRTIPKGCDA
jgi:hypothetical protein